METNILFLIFFTLIFYIVGGCVDYWQAARHHKLIIPKLLKNYFALFWLILYSGILPFLLVYTASNFNVNVSLKYIGAFLIGASLWDFIFAYLFKGTPIVGIKDYWFWGNKNYGLSKNQIILWHVVRIFAGLFIIFQK